MSTAILHHHPPTTSRMDGGGSAGHPMNNNEQKNDCIFYNSKSPTRSTSSNSASDTSSTDSYSDHSSIRRESPDDVNHHCNGSDREYPKQDSSSSPCPFKGAPKVPSESESNSAVAVVALLPIEDATNKHPIDAIEKKDDTQDCTVTSTEGTTVQVGDGNQGASAIIGITPTTIDSITTLSTDTAAATCSAIIPYTTQTPVTLLTTTDADTHTNTNIDATTSSVTDNDTPSTTTIVPSSNHTTPDFNENIPHKGIVNLGNTCYLNAGLQMLMSIDGFVDEVIALYQQDMELGTLETMATDDDDDATAQENSDKEEPPTSDSSPKNQDAKYPLRDALARFFLSIKHYEQNNDTSNTTSMSKGAANPMELKKQIDEMTPLFVGFWQQDSHEFLSTLLDLLHDEIVNEQKEDEKTNEVENENEIENGVPAQDASSSSENVGTTTIIDEKLSSNYDIETKNNGDDGKQEHKQSVDAEEKLVKSAVATAENGNIVAPMEVDTDTGTCLNDSTHSEWGLLSTSTSTVALEPTSVSASSPMNDAHVPDEEMDDDFVVVEKDQHQEPPTFSDDQASNPGINLEYSASSKKKPRVDSPPDRLTKTSSFSGLNLNEISSLLHGTSKAKPKCSEEVTKPLAVSSNVSCKLVGGRIASTTAPPSIRMAEREQDEVPNGGAAINSTDNNDDNEHKEDITDAAGEENMLDESSQESSADPPKPLWSNNVVDNWFTMGVRTHLTCDSCNYSRSHEEVYRYLSIEVGPAPDCDSVGASHERTIQENIRKFFKPERRELKCEKCFCESATQSTEIIKLPRALVIHLKRFIVDVSEDYSSITYRKNQAAFEFGHDLSLDENDHDGALGDFLSTDVSYPARHDGNMRSSEEYTHSADFEDAIDFDAKSISGESYMDVANINAIQYQKYKIRSVVNHIGNSANCGHYTADAYKLYGEDDIITKEDELSASLESSSHEFGRNRKWTRFNDSFVSGIEEADALGEKAQETAYMITYELRDIYGS